MFKKGRTSFKNKQRYLYPMEREKYLGADAICATLGDQ